MTTQNWPDPNRPGVPLFPEQEGWHVMEGRSAGQTALTHWNGIEWGGGEQVRALNTSPEWYRYVGAVLTPAQINEMLAAERERCAKLVKQEVTNLVGDKRQFLKKAHLRTVLKSIIQEIRNLGDPS